MGVGGHTKAVALLLLSCATPHAQEERGMTPLHFAAASGCQDSCAALLREGANRWVLDDCERDPFACLPQHCLATREDITSWLMLLRPTGTVASSRSNWEQIR